MNRSINKILPAALEVTKDLLANNDAISKEFNGYISSFGAAVIQSGLKPAVAFFETKGSADEDRTLLMKAILRLITKDDKNDGKLLDYIIRNEKNRTLKKEILDAAAALKLAIRTFKLVEKEGNHGTS